MTPTAYAMLAPLAALVFLAIQTGLDGYRRVRRQMPDTTPSPQADPAGQRPSPASLAPFQVIEGGKSACRAP